MSSSPAPWLPTRGLGRLLAQETNISDLIQLLSDRDPSPWAALVGFVPDQVTREAREASRADLFLSSRSSSAVVEVKLGHLLSDSQQAGYEALPSRPDLYLAALSLDEARFEADSGRWGFLSLSELVGRWQEVDDQLARLVAREAADVIRAWDRGVSAVFEPRSAKTWAPLSALNQKFLARVVTRRISRDLEVRGRLASAGVTSGGGLSLVQGWTPVRGEGADRAFIAEVRWWESKQGGELRFGVDFEPRPGQDEDEEIRRAAYELARRMDAVIEHRGLVRHLAEVRPDLAGLLRRDKPSRPQAKGDWEQVILHGFRGAPLPGGGRNNRRLTSPDFFGDRALRFEAISGINFDEASARDITDLVDCTLDYLAARQP